MKDLVITSKRVKKEFCIFSVCFVIAFIINVIAVTTYKTPWSEVFTQIGYVIIIAILLYLLSAFVRGLIRFFLVLLSFWKKRIRHCG